MLRKNIAAVSIGASLFIAHVAQADPLTATRYGDFDRYVLALSWQTGFCQSQYDRNNKPPVECRLDKEPKDKTSYLTVHGLWPGAAEIHRRARRRRGALDALWLRHAPCSRYA